MSLSFFIFRIQKGCGGALIHEDIILTAAHCKWAYYDTMSVMIGSNTIDNVDNVGENIDIDKFAIHPMQDPDGYVNDIMLILLSNSSKAIPFTINRDQTIPKPLVDSMSVMGFGKTSENGTTFPDTLQVVDGIVAFPSKKCAEQWPLAMNETFLCAGTVKGGKDACDSDSGNPFIVNNTVVAISGDGVGCGRKNILSVNQRVSAFVDWIDENICLLSNNPPSKCKTIAIQQVDDVSEEKSINDKKDTTTDMTIAPTNSTSTTLAVDTNTYDSYFDETGDDDSYNTTSVITSTDKITNFKVSNLEIFSIILVGGGAIVLAYRYCQRFRGKRSSYERIQEINV